MRCSLTGISGCYRILLTIHDLAHSGNAMASKHIIELDKLKWGNACGKYIRSHVLLFLTELKYDKFDLKIYDYIPRWHFWSILLQMAYHLINRYISKRRRFKLYRDIFPEYDNMGLNCINIEN